MLIFDGFHSTARAEAFAAYIRAEFGKAVIVCASQGESDSIGQSVKSTLISNEEWKNLGQSATSLAPACEDGRWRHPA